ncbi:MAG: RDD family protein [Moorella sp. (in: Bacteria)]|nr:RDD family protein [Moorella sp. (in: firmicutes)]
MADFAGGTGPAPADVPDYAPGSTSPPGSVQAAGAVQIAGTPPAPAATTVAAPVPDAVTPAAGTPPAPMAGYAATAAPAAALTVTYPASPAPPPQGAPAAAPAAFDYPKAGLGRRILAYLLDGFFATFPFLILLFFGLAGFLAALKAGSIGYRDLSSSAFGSATAVLLLLGTVVSLLWALFYTFFRDGFGGGRSWGKRICGLMVVRLADNRPCTLGLSFVRNVVSVILVFILTWIPVAGWFAGFVEPVVAAVHGKGWRIGDMLAKTQVIDAGKYRLAETTCQRSEGRSG